MIGSPMNDAALVTTLGVALLLGMRHALDADHVAAMATFAGRRQGLRDALRNGLSWGAGHAVAVALVGGLLIALRLGLPDRVGRLLETLVGVMLVGLGCGAIVDALRSRLHAHRHEHDGIVHSHLHFHPVPHGGEAPHRHPHPFSPALRPFLVGSLHGLAGSGVVVLLVLSTLPGLLAGLAFLGLFGIGSMIGMGLVSLVLGAPWAMTSGGGFLHLALRAAAGLASILTGVAALARLGPPS
jgi:ABC-type nickel/cobalt efflux system permease component RcnA